jgi:Trehalase
VSGTTSVFSSIETLRAEALALLHTNDAGAYTKPSAGQYPHQWNWDSAIISMGWARTSVSRALTELRSLLEAQWDDGMVPHIVFHDPGGTYFPDANFWETANVPKPHVATSGITQPPIFATCLRTIVERNASRPEVRAFVIEAFPKLVRWHRWFHTDRAIDETGITAVLHPWESGTDDSPRFLSVLDSIVPTEVPPYQRVDQHHVHGDERPSDADYDRFVHLLDFQRKTNWNQRESLALTPFAIQCTLTNSILHRANVDLAWLGEWAGLRTSDIGEVRSWIRRTQRTFSDVFWNEEDQCFYDVDVRTGKQLRVITYATFLPLWAGLADARQTQALTDLAKDPAHFGHETLLFSTTSRSVPEWRANQYWRGPIWVIANWFVSGAFDRSGDRQLANQIRQSTVKLLLEHGFAEYYDADTGLPCGARAFSWSASLVLDLLDSLNRY